MSAESLGVSNNVNVTRNPSHAQNETSIAADPNDHTNLVGGANDYRTGDPKAGFAYSFDSGLTWVPRTLAGTDSSLGKYDAQGDPAVAAYRDGVFHYAFIDFNWPTYYGELVENRLAVATSLDGGVTWPRLGVIIDHEGPGSNDFEDKEYIAVDNTGGSYDGNVYVTWTRFPAFGSSRIMFARSTDGGQTFSSPQQISDTSNGYQGSVPAVGPGGEIYVVWQHGASIEFDKSTDGGVSWGTDVLVANISEFPTPFGSEDPMLPGASFRVNNFPTLDVDKSGGAFDGRLYVAWADELGVGSGPDILLSRSTDGGTQWSPPIAISDDTNSEYQWFPWISVDPVGGVVHAIFFDRRDAPSSGLYHTYYTQSTDGGLSFLANVRVSDEISDSSNDGFGGTFIGDYNGLTATSTAVHSYWTDVRDSNMNAEGYTAAVTEVPDLDGDGIEDAIDNCPGNPNGPGGGTCTDGHPERIRELCDTDSDCGPGGGFCSLDQEDYEPDGVGDACDNCPIDPNPGQADNDKDGIGNICDPTPGSAGGGGGHCGKKKAC